MSGFTFRATAPEEADRIRQFLASVFRMGMDTPAFEEKLIHWKYYQPRPDWNGSRSYVLESGGEIVSHGCVWPMRLVTPSGAFPSSQIGDWAADPNVPGAGMLLRREVEKLVDVSVAIGGSPDSRRLIPRMGYSEVASFRKFVRVVRPVRQLRRRPEPEVWRRLAKFGRGAVWALKPIPALPENWTVVPLEHVTEIRGDYAFAARSTALYRYLLDCPSGALSAYVLKIGDREAGYFLLNQVDGQTRIADIQTSDWPAAVIAATHTAARIPETCEIVANASLDRFADALVEAGYQPRTEQPVYLLDRSKVMAGVMAGLEVHIASADYDDFFARFPESPFAA